MSIANIQMALNLCAPNINGKKISFCVNIIFVSKVLSPNLSRYLNIISTLQTLLSYGFGGLKLKKIKIPLFIKI